MNEVVVQFDDVALNCVVDGPEDGTLALCLHGFPDTRATFRHLAPTLVDLGYRVVRPAMRGYAPSSLATDDSYQVAALAHDANRLHEYFGGGSDAVLIGHDWGAGATYLATLAAPQRWRRAVTIAVPPLGRMAAGFLDIAQLKTSWYMWLAGSPFGEFAFSANDLAIITQLWADWSPGYDGRDDVARVRDALGDPGRVRAAVSYYRDMFRPATNPDVMAVATAQTNAPTVPILYLQGDACGCVLMSTVGEPLTLLAPGSRYEVIDGAGHFAQLEQPERVNALVSEWLAN